MMMIHIHMYAPWSTSDTYGNAHYGTLQAATCLEACDALLHREDEATQGRSTSTTTPTYTPPAAAAATAEAGQEARRDKLAFTRADVSRRWAALYGHLLAAASELLEAGGAVGRPPPPAPSRRTMPMTITFPSLGIPPAPAAAALPASPAAVRTYAQARPLFLQASRHLEAARAYFRLDGFVTDHAHLQRELSRLYRHLSSFEAVRALLVWNWVGGWLVGWVGGVEARLCSAGVHVHVTQQPLCTQYI